MHHHDETQIGVNVLGPVMIGDVPLTRRQQAIVAALACLGDGNATTERVIDAVWGESVPSSARASLQNQVTRLRRTFGPDVIETIGHGYRLTRPTDAEVFEDLTSGAPTLGCGPDTVARLERARDLWRGAPYDCLGGVVEADIARARLDALRADALDHLALCRIALGDIETAVTELEALVHEDPYRERRWELMMRALHLGGRRAEALATYNRVAELLRRDLGVTPSHQLTQLEVQIRHSIGPPEDTLAVA